MWLVFLLSAGDNCERSNAAVGPHGAVTQYMDPTDREGRLERVAFRYGRELDGNLASILVTMSIRAYKEFTDASAEEQKRFSLLCERAAAGSEDGLTVRIKERKGGDGMVVKVWLVFWRS